MLFMLTCFVSFTKAHEKWLRLTNEQESPLVGTQKTGQKLFVKTAQEMISRMDDKRSKVFNALQGTFGSQRLNVVPCKNLVLKLDDQQHRISIGLRLGANICVAHTCHCGKTVERDGSHGLSCTKNWSLLKVRENLLKDNLPKPNLPNVKDNLPNFFGNLSLRICRIL